MLKIKSFEFNPFGEKTYLVWDPDTLQAMVIDPGMSNAAERDELDRFVAREHLNIKYMVNTHLHLDHTWGNDHVTDTYGTATSASPADAMLGRRRAEQAQMFGMREPMKPLDITHHLHDGDRMALGGYIFEVISVPGHSPGGLALYCPQGGVLFSGDSLFAGSVGRTDLPGGDMNTLLDAITAKLLTLPETTTVFPGHGPSTTIGRERSSNPFLR